MLKFISKHILTGLVTILPVVLTLYLLYWLAITAETLLSDLLHLWLPEVHYWPGMGMIVGLAVAFLVGILMHAWAVQVLFAKGEALLYRTPVIRSIYPALRDFLNYFSAESRREFDQVVVVTMGDSGMKVIGFVTQKDPKHLPEGFRDEDSILVYLPLSYMIGGYAVLMPKSAVQPIDMSMEDAMRFTLTAGVTGATHPGGNT